MSETLQLYVKTSCPWCVRAQQFLDARGYNYQLIDVEADAAQYTKMRKLSGQSLTPTLLVGDFLLPDFGPDELEVFLRKHQITPDAR